MTKFFLGRLLRGLISVCIVVAIVMIMIYSMLDRNQIFASDPQYSKVSNNDKTVYKYRTWKEFGYIDYITYADYLLQRVNDGTLDEETRAKAAKIGRKASNDNSVAAQYIEEFTKDMEAQGYTVIRLEAIMKTPKTVAPGGQAKLFAYRDRPLYLRLTNYFSHLVEVDNIHKVEDDVGERGLTFTLHDPLYGGEKFSPAIIGNGTLHKYLLYCDNSFPYIHQNLFTINLGKSYSVNKNIEVTTTMTKSQGSFDIRTVTYPTGLVEESADDLHSAIYQSGSLEGNVINQERFLDNYTSVQTFKTGMSRMGYSFTIGIIATLLSYLIGLPLGVLVALKKDKFADQIGTAYIVFIMAVPSLSYILIFKALGNMTGLPTTFIMDSKSKLMFILPIVSLMLPAVGRLMRWLRRFMIDQMNSDYVKFARSGGLGEGEIFTKHIFKNAAIPIVHGIPGALLGAMTGAFITERVYVVPGIGGLLINAIGAYDNGVIVGVTLFYATITVLSTILGDALMAMVDPRISFTTKAR
ncbi:MAG: ABC transporter permease [Oscillospiraceae bacterium]|nr:ABC transporter permease [Oscillospiraceae bacterium]